MICLRPHHGMCLAYFEGKGYSDGFTVNMQKMLEFFEKGADIDYVFKSKTVKAQILSLPYPEMKSVKSVRI